MPLKTGSDQATINDNISCILKGYRTPHAEGGTGCGYDPPYKDPSRKEYTPAQAAAIAYAKAGKRNNTGGGGGKKAKKAKPAEKPKTESKAPESTPKKKNEPIKAKKAPASTEQKQPDPNSTDLTPELISQFKIGLPGVDIKNLWGIIDKDTKKELIKTLPAAVEYEKAKKKSAQPSTTAPAPAPAPQTPEGWKTKDSTPGPVEQKAKPQKFDDAQMKKDVEEGYKYKWGDSGGVDFIIDEWDKLTDKAKSDYHKQAQKFLAEKQQKEKTQIPKSSPSPSSQPPAPDGWKTDEGTPQFDNNGQLVVGGKTFKPGKKLPGSTAPVLFVDDQGKGAWVVKSGGKNGGEGQNIAENTANKIYNSLSSVLPTSPIESHLVDGKLVNKYLDGAVTLDDLNSSQYNKFKDTINKRMKRTLMADALLANWDFAGMSNDNIMIDNAGNLTRIDTGGTFNYRAQGESKSFTPLPMEIWTLRGSQGKQFWDTADESDYKHLWLNQTRAISSNFNEMRNIVKDSQLPDDIKAAFNKRMQSLFIANREIKEYMNKYGEPTSWKQVDGAIKIAFENSKNVDPNSLTWEKTLRDNIQKELNSLKPKAISGLDFTLVDDAYQYKFNQNIFEDTVKKIDKQLANSVTDEFGDPEPLKNLSPAQKYVIREYSGSLYSDINKFLRGTKTTDSNDKFLQQVVTNLDEGLESLPDAGEGIYYRMNGIKFERQEQIDAIKNLKPGDTYSSPAYLSFTSEDSGAVMESFHYPNSKFSFIFKYEGSKMKKIAPMSSYVEEEESLTKRNQKFKVVKSEMIPTSTFSGLRQTNPETLMITITDADD